MCWALFWVLEIELGISWTRIPSSLGEADSSQVRYVVCPSVGSAGVKNQQRGGLGSVWVIWGVTVSNGGVRVGLPEKVAFEQRPAGGGKGACRSLEEGFPRQREQPVQSP